MARIGGIEELFWQSEIGRRYQDAVTVSDTETMAELVVEFGDEERAMVARWHKRTGCRPVPEGLTLQ